jgi:hypothetical protein
MEDHKRSKLNMKEILKNKLKYYIRKLQRDQLSKMLIMLKMVKQFKWRELLNKLKQFKKNKME